MLNLSTATRTRRVNFLDGFVTVRERIASYQTLAALVSETQNAGSIEDSLSPSIAYLVEYVSALDGIEGMPWPAGADERRAFCDQLPPALITKIAMGALAGGDDAGKS